MNLIKLNLLILLMLTGLIVNGQVKNGVVYKLRGGNTLKGELLSSSSSVIKVKLVDSSIHEINPGSVKKSYGPDNITLYDNGSYRTTNGGSLYLSCGLSFDHVSVNITYNQKLGPHFEAGIGLGYHENWFDIPANNTNQWFIVQGTPLFLNGKYFPLKQTRIRPYIKASIGLNNNFTNWEILEINNKLMYELGFGSTFPITNNIQLFAEINQYSTQAKGIGTTWDFDAGTQSNVNINFNIWINQIVPRAGLFFNFAY